MYVLYSEDRPTILPHQCNTLELVEIVKNYIESKHECVIKIKESPGFVYYDAPSPLKSIKKELYNINIGPISVRIDDVGILSSAILSKKAEFDKGFCRIACFYNNICLTENEFNEAKQYVIDNEELLDEYCKEASRIIIGK